jgi:hypothetical protein
MAVVVASAIITKGGIIGGDVSRVVVVKTDPGYAPDPGHAGTGTVVAVLCQESHPLAVYLANGRSLARTVHVPAHACYTIDVRRDLPALRNSLHGALLVSTSGAGFIAEQSIYDEGRSAGYSTAGLAQ